ncbi:UNVERIFIED_ORG: hypothetical protein ABIB63_001857 [Xanthomonas axonopodis]
MGAPSSYTLAGETVMVATGKSSLTMVAVALDGLPTE